MFNVLICNSDEKILGVVSRYIEYCFRSENEPFTLIARNNWKKCLIACGNLQEIDLFVFDLHAESSEWDSILSLFVKEKLWGLALFIFDSAKRSSVIPWPEIKKVCRQYGFMTLDLRNLYTKYFYMTIIGAIHSSKARRRLCIEISCERKKMLVDPSDIIYCEICQKLLSIICRTKHVFTVRLSLKKIEEFLKNRGFCRIHRSYLVNLNDIEYFTAGYLKLCDSTLLPVGGRYRKSTLDAIRAWKTF